MKEIPRIEGYYDFRVTGAVYILSGAGGLSGAGVCFWLVWRSGFGWFLEFQADVAAINTGVWVLSSPVHYAGFGVPASLKLYRGRVMRTTIVDTIYAMRVILISARF